jgi:hypothetical protein
VKKALPIVANTVHARWSGEAIWVQVNERIAHVPPENATSHPAVGELLFYPGGLSEKEILIPYGPCRFASKAGTLAGNHFATIETGAEELARVGLAVLWEGAKEIKISPSGQSLGKHGREFSQGNRRACSELQSRLR